MNDQRKHKIDRYSYELGAMDCFCEMVAAGLKKLAMSHPWESSQERDSYLEDVKKLCIQYDVKCCPEDDILKTDLFPKEVTQDKYIYLFFRTDAVIEEYMQLKERRKNLEKIERTAAEDDGIRKQRLELAREFGRLLSYSEEGIERLVQKAAR